MGDVEEALTYESGWLRGGVDPKSITVMDILKSLPRIDKMDDREDSATGYRRVVR